MYELRIDLVITGKLMLFPSPGAGVIHVSPSAHVKMEIEPLSTQFCVYHMHMSCCQSLDHMPGSSYKGMWESEFPLLPWGNRAHNEGISYTWEDYEYKPVKRGSTLLVIREMLMKATIEVLPHTH